MASSIALVLSPSSIGEKTSANDWSVFLLNRIAGPLVAHSCRRFRLVHVPMGPSENGVPIRRPWRSSGDLAKCRGTWKLRAPVQWRKPISFNHGGQS
jgi:hypothetical protein